MINRYLFDIIFGVLYIIMGFMFMPLIIKKGNFRKTNTCFCVVISIFYFFSILTSSFKGNTPNLKMVTPISNISPLLFTLCFVSIFLKENIKEKLFKFMVIFNFVMFIAAFISPVFGLIAGSFYFQFVIFDVLGHLTYGLFVFYLLFSKQISISKKELLIIMSASAGIVLFVFVLNIIFDAQFFGLCLNEKYNIYGQKLFDNYHISNIVYVLSLMLVTLIGYFITKIVNRYCRSK